MLFPVSHERVCDLHEMGLVRWWAKDHTQVKLQLEDAAGPSG
jgi:hypothetical protein